jgi:glycosyltransferase involved in cell wall biosynthesis
LISRLYQLARTRVAVNRGNYSQITIDIEDFPLRAAIAGAQDVSPVVDVGQRRSRSLIASARRALRAALRIPQGIARLAGWRLVLVYAGWQLPELPDRPLLSYTHVPKWWTALSGVAPRDRFLPLAKCGGVDGYFAWLDAPSRLWRQREAIGRLIAAERLWPLQRAIRLRDAWMIARPARLGALARVWKWASGLDCRFLGFPVGPVIAEEVQRCLSSGELVQDTLVTAAVSRAVSQLKPRAIVYRAELATSEHALVAGAGGQTCTIGFIHYPFWENYLGMRFTAREKKKWLGTAVDGDRPLPDAFICNGVLLARHLESDGVPRDRVALCGPQRLAGLVAFQQRARSRDDLRSALGFSGPAPIVFVALAVRERDTEALFAALFEALHGRGDVRLIIRTHPNRPTGDAALRAAIDALGPGRAHFVPDGADLYEWLALADVMVCIGSTVAFEAMALGIPAIVFQNPATFDVNGLNEYRDALFVVRDGRELGAALQAVFDGAASVEMKRRHWPETLDGVLGDRARPLGGQLSAAFATLGVDVRPVPARHQETV